jgi:hypothetical protein
MEFSFSLGKAAAAINVISYAPAVSYPNFNTSSFEMLVMLVNMLVHYLRRQSACHALQQPHLRTRNMNSDERIFKTNESLFTPFNHKGKDDL